ncbi:histidinol-phosphatase HisJ [Listeria booriae]|uniref:Histidinol-phosphatase n=2 Tax=Listeria TaxID=1637 RepID=A0A7X1CAK9_9LIST|nr:histidinol-phosphatase HisJ [Listeria booriae]MBC1490501.1 histidinol-phosphatase HisJ [Listeria booriae]MBC1525395.1 histidinol-phosphatase HisJ [Listeria booriae]
MKKWDGHTHTEFCPHGSGDLVETMIEKAIGLGFTDYSITEHPPMPAAFEREIANSPEDIATAALRWDQLDAYFKKAHEMKQKYKDQIRIHVGLEVDFLPGFEADTRALLREYGSQMDDGVLSLHFMPGVGGWRFIDFSATDFEAGIWKHYGSFAAIQKAYYGIIRESLFADLGPAKPRRLGHISLCQKFQHYFKNDQTAITGAARDQVSQLLKEVKDQQYQLDWNTAGLYKEFCQETYPPLDIAQVAQSLGIELIYGSDSHALEDIGRGYNYYEKHQ